MKTLVASLLWLGLGAPASACKLTFLPNFVPTASSRIAGIELVVKHGAIESLQTVPIGWQFTIDNDPSWTTKISGLAIVGAAFLQPSDLSNMISIKPEPGHGCLDLQKSHLVSVILKLYRRDIIGNFTVDYELTHLSE